MLLLGACAGLHTAYLERVRVGAVGPDFDFTFLERVLIASRAFLFYPAKLALPWPLMFTYPRWEIHAADPFSWLPVLFCIVVLGCVIVGLRNGPRGVSLGVLFYAVTIFPALGFSNFYPMRFSFVADHFVYHASLGLIAAAVGGVALMCRNRVVARGLLAAVGIVFAVLVFRQGFMYADEETLWRRTLQLNPTAVVAHNNLALLAMQTGNIAQSEYHSREAIRLKSNDYVPYINLTHALRLQGRPDEAIEQADRAIQELEGLIDLHAAAGRGETVDRLWKLKTDMVFVRSDLVQSRDRQPKMPTLAPPRR
jgi:protein O-mannosyl-transferase